MLQLGRLQTDSHIFNSCRIKPDETKQIISSIDPKQATEGDEELKAAGKPVIFQAKFDMEQISNGGFDPSEHLLGLPPAHGEKARNLKEVKFNELCSTSICFYLGLELLKLWRTSFLIG